MARSPGTALTSRQRRAVPHLRSAVVRLSRLMRQEFQDEQLTPSQLAVLGTLVNLGEQTPGELAAREHVRPPTMSKILGALESDGWVVRVPHPDDGRQTLIRLTPRATEWIVTYREARDSWLEQRLSQLSDADRDLVLAAVPVLEQLAAPSRR